MSDSRRIISPCGCREQVTSRLFDTGVSSDLEVQSSLPKSH
jgi:hypothetical protein